VLFEDDYWHVGTAVGPVVWPGFLIVKLKRHCEHVWELTQQEAAALGPILRDTCASVSSVFKLAKVYVCSFGDGVKHIHFWVLPRPQHMQPGMHWVILNLDMRLTITRLGIRRWVCHDEEVATWAERLRRKLRELRMLGG
jgi:diadenosine tetraphosphate (Ap4A) HIT family hydrolase